MGVLGSRSQHIQPAHRSRKEALWALHNVSFRVAKGETLGIIGSNGSGKSTCLKLLTRIYAPTTGSVSVDGRVSALLELGAGFHPELTGRENVYLYGSILGISRRAMRERFDDIVSFSEMARFVDEPIKFYSSGMYVRLAFATAISVNPDVLLIDEVLAVGDQRFQAKCLERIHALKTQGTTIVFVSHDLDTVAQLCDRAIWLASGRLRSDGATCDVIGDYLHDVYGDDGTNLTFPRAPEPTARSAPSVAQAAETVATHAEDAATARRTPEDKEADASPSAESATEEGAGGAPELDRSAPGRWGSMKMEIERVRLLNAQGCHSARAEGLKPLTIEITYHAHRPVCDPVLGVAIYGLDGGYVVGTNTMLGGCETGEVSGVGTIALAIPSLPLLQGGYVLTVAAHSADESEVYDWHNLLYQFTVFSADGEACEGLVHLDATWSHVAQAPEPECSASAGDAAVEAADTDAEPTHVADQVEGQP